MRLCSTTLVIAMLALAACGDDSGDGDQAPAQPPVAQETTAPPETTTREEPEPDGTEIVVRDSEFGPMLFDSNRQAIYIFQNDAKDKTVCYDECAEAWPPVYTDGEPQAGKGTKQSLLGTVKRRDGKQQVTYAGKPLYFYAHEEPGEVRCHNVFLNGGLWWVVGPDGKRRP